MSHLQNITVPSHWPLPKYSLGQPTQKGIIVGIQYYPDDLMALTGSGYWRYAVVDKNDYSEISHLSEQKIQPLTPQEISAELHVEIEAHQQKISILQATFRSVEFGSVELTNTCSNNAQA
ncbi:hypothetical protein FNW02_37155 [Komarekiella sp. 'clone 1']|uniref:Uncharacterized protein n=1 Tax=Komarekiella delphini-convector SJRDD-AB1 TaxID=2593771 RepID=A0AA40VVQ8_9NOST|nr:hypothetical protein [Komarekiella delphini-convector]MBD6621178.1 hypothetical protein [Komarekiella delphini-convector SJRDD-AB1]